MDRKPRSSDVSRSGRTARIVCHHPLVRASATPVYWSRGFAKHLYRFNAGIIRPTADQARFQHYLDTEDRLRIECEIGQIESHQPLNIGASQASPGILPPRAPHLDADSSLGQFSPLRYFGMDDEPHRRLAERVYGLSEWPRKAPARASRSEQRIPLSLCASAIPHGRLHGRFAVVISNMDLEDLIISVLDARTLPLMCARCDPW